LVAGGHVRALERAGVLEVLDTAKRARREARYYAITGPNAGIASRHGPARGV
jgi:hypothetical protein